MSKHLYDIFKHWGNDIWIYSDPHFRDFESYKLRGFIQVISEQQFNEGAHDISYEDFINIMIKKADEEQIKRINAKCGKKSTLIILGDIGDIECVKKLKARYKILIMGNHDKGASNYKRVIKKETKYDFEFDYDIYNDSNLEQFKSEKWSLKESSEGTNLFERVVEDNHLFDEVYEGPLFINSKLVLSHEPIMSYNGCWFNIHGHVHNIHYIKDDYHMNFCAEVINYEPVNLIGLIKKGLLKDINNIHRQTIDNATERKEGHENKN